MKYFDVFTKVNKIIAALLIVAGLTACGSDKSSTESTSLDIKEEYIVMNLQKHSMIYIWVKKEQ